MPRITPVHYKVLKKIFEMDGFVFKRQKGDHLVFEKEGVLRPVIIPAYSEIDQDIIKSNMKTAGMTRERYFELLAKCK